MEKKLATKQAAERLALLEEINRLRVENNQLKTANEKVTREKYQILAELNAELEMQLGITNRPQKFNTIIVPLRGGLLKAN